MQPLDQHELLLLVADCFERLGIPYFVTGSIASTHFGKHRFTYDVDMVAKVVPDHAAALLRQFPSPDFYLSEDAIHSAVRHFGQFNIIHPAGGLKVDVMIPRDDAFNQSRFARTRTVEIQPQRSAKFSAPEDVILKKLESHLEGRSERHLNDIASMLEISGDQIDFGYIERWLDPLRVREVWETVRRRVERP